MADSTALGLVLIGSFAVLILGHAILEWLETPRRRRRSHIRR